MQEIFFNLLFILSSNSSGNQQESALFKVTPLPKLQHRRYLNPGLGSKLSTLTTVLYWLLSRYHLFSRTVKQIIFRRPGVNRSFMFNKTGIWFCLLDIHHMARTRHNVTTAKGLVGLEIILVLQCIEYLFRDISRINITSVLYIANCLISFL